MQPTHKIIKNGQVVADQWQTIDLSVESDATIPAEGDWLIPWSYWLEHADTLTQRDGNTAPVLDGELDFASLMAEHGDTLLAQPLIGLAFPAFKDGRCYSFARLLRERYGYQGELRALGDILQDQIFPMARCGINAFAVRADHDPADAIDGLQDFTVKYQPAADEANPIFRQSQA